jgi:hypothetical protein
LKVTGRNLLKSAFGSVADILTAMRLVRFVPKAVIGADTKQVCLALVSPARKVNYHSTSGGHFDMRVASPGEGLKRLG